ncbi:MAG: acyl-CoA dehydratase activase-related protein [Candidatus Woesearchaeota archaeon]|jgi:activator of 2-hydroxyglutaryl-CoA dehydratase/predicted nucleotide-binding protein (sugar kinase/HSP70/actin superfamily)
MNQKRTNLTSNSLNELKEDLILIDAGVENIHVVFLNENKLINELVINNNDEMKFVLENHKILDELKIANKVLITGKMSEIVRKTISNGKIISSSAALWQAAKYKIQKHNSLIKAQLLKNEDVESQNDLEINVFEQNVLEINAFEQNNFEQNNLEGDNSQSYNFEKINTYGIIDLSASGYSIICVNSEGELFEDLLTINPKCGAGSGINLSRILEKLDISKEEVDSILSSYLGDDGQEKRKKVTVRADRCGVFSSSATISDKNQGIPLDFALATTLKSEVLKACKKMSPGVDVVILSGRVFMWKYARDCAKDYLENTGVKKVLFDNTQQINIMGLYSLTRNLGFNKIRNYEDKKLTTQDKPIEYPSFKTLKEEYEKKGLFLRLTEEKINELSSESIQNIPVNIGIDAGSTMAKIAICSAETDEIIKLDAYNNHGDTVETVKKIWQSLKDIGINSLNIQHIGITGSGRYQVQKVLSTVYPNLSEKIFTLVENYAHAHGSLEYAKEQIEILKKTIPDINENFYSLVDIGGEDTKLTVVALKKEDLFDNAMNVKCSAGTGSLMDTLKSLFGIKSISDACTLAFNAEKSAEINATCAVFLMENAKKLQAEGYPKDQILASCNFAIVENMSRTLWNKIDIPKNSIVLLHGQTMQSDPLPLAVTHKMQEKSNVYCIIPPYPGHRACLGLIKSIKDKKIINTVIRLNDFLETKSSKKIFFCRGAACGDSNSCCARTSLTLNTVDSAVNVLLGGCTTINSVGVEKNKNALNKDCYKEIWSFIDSKLPKSKEENRLVIPRSFAVSEQAYFLSRIFERLGINVHVDNIIEEDILKGQPYFPVDVCAPLIGAVGQYERLAKEKHGLILVPQIDFLPSNGNSLGRTCTTNQGGVLIAMHHAKLKSPDSKFYLLELSLDKMEPEYLTAQLYLRLKDLMQFYNINIDRKKMIEIIRESIEDEKKLRKELALKVNEFIEYAIDNKKNVAIVCGREYILNPGIYDSHVGRLLKDKGLIAIPSYAIDIKLNEDYSHIYWKNPHDIITKIEAITNKKFNTIIINEELKKSINLIEQNSTHTNINIVQVSTFRCGPDTMTSHLTEDLARKKPNLLIQSDAMIKELAHLENRINTFLNQIEKKLHEEYVVDEFKIELINKFESGAINKDKDVVYFPTLHENRMITSVIKGAGITVIDNYEDETYNLKKKVMIGRKYAGDAVCAPFAAVFADIVLAATDFVERKKRNDPLVEGKTRMLVFDNKGTGPCRQGQYYELHKLLLHRKFKDSTEQIDSKQEKIEEKYSDFVKLIVSEEKNGFNIGLDEWVLIQAFQGLVLQGILHSCLIKAGNVCNSIEEYSEFMKDYTTMKNQMFELMETSLEPNKRLLNISNKISKGSKHLGFVGKYFAYGLHNNNGFRKIIKSFSNKWLKKQNRPKIKIHVEGEAYIRVAQIEEIFKETVDLIGLGSFEMTYSPLWSYLELLLEENLNTIQSELKLFEQLIISTQDKTKLSELKELIKSKKKDLKNIINFKQLLRKILVNPIYSAARIDPPHEISHTLHNAKKIVSSLKPHGELPPYIGEALAKSEEGYDLFLNVAPESCMISSMGQSFTEPILNMTNKKMRIQGLFTLNGEVDKEKLELALLKTSGPEKFYSI